MNELEKLEDHDELSDDRWDDLVEAMNNGTYQPKKPDPTWHAVSDPYSSVTWTPSLVDAVLFGDTPCPYCNGTGQVDVTTQWGDEDTYRSVKEKCRHIYSCAVRLRYIRRLLPARYERSNLFTLEPSTASKMSLERQASIIEHLTANPSTSYLFFGAPGTSKTTFATALVRIALERNWGSPICKEYGRAYPTYYETFWIHYLNWDSYIQSLLDWQNHPDDAEPPVVTPELIRRSAKKGRKSTIAIEEIDKSRLTEFKANKLFDLVCAVDETQSQLIIATNHTSVESFQRWLYKTDNPGINIAGEATWRRIEDNCKPINCKSAHG